MYNNIESVRLLTEAVIRTVKRPRLEQTHNYVNLPGLTKRLREYSEYRLSLLLCKHYVKEYISTQERWQHLLAIDLFLKADKKPHEKWK